MHPPRIQYVHSAGGPGGVETTYSLEPSAKATPFVNMNVDFTH